MTTFCEWCGAALKDGGSLVHLGEVVCDDCFELSCTDYVVPVSFVDELDADLTECFPCALTTRLARANMRHDDTTPKGPSSTRRLASELSHLLEFLLKNS